MNKSYKLDKRIKAHKLEEQILELESKINALRKEQKVIQLGCEHPGLRREYKSDTGNYDPSCDSYWANLFCPKCLRSWMADSGEPFYSKSYRKN